MSMRDRPAGNTQVVSLVILVFLITIGLSGCTSNQNSNEAAALLSGTWAGDGGLSLSEEPMNSSVTQLSFDGSQVQITMESERGTFNMTYTYTITADLLVFEPSFSRRGGFPGSHPGNWTMPPNGTRPWNGTQPPMNGSWAPNGTHPTNQTWPSNRTQPPFGGAGGSLMTVSFHYRFDEQQTVLYLNDSPFTKV